MAGGETIVPVAIREVLGASSAISVQQLIVYVPDKDRNGEYIQDIDAWIEYGLEVLSKIGGGATAILDVLGAWLNPETDKLIREETSILYTYVIAEEFSEHLPKLRAFLHEFGSATNQGEVLFHWDGVAYRIVKFDEDEET